MEMRAVYAEYLAKLMENDKRVVVLDADLAKASGTRALYERFPEQMFDCGVAEQDMASIAAGLSSYGFKPWIETFTPFATRRICDQVAISISYAKRNVKIVGTDPGIAAELNGGTHMSVEDIGVLRFFDEDIDVRRRLLGRYVVFVEQCRYQGLPVGTLLHFFKQKRAGLVEIDNAVEVERQLVDRYDHIGIRYLAENKVLFDFHTNTAFGVIIIQFHINCKQKGAPKGS